MSRANLMRILPVLALAVVLSACGGDPSGPQLDTFDAVIDNGGTYEVVEPSQNIELISSDEEVLGDGTITLCTVERYSIVDAPLNYATFDPSAEVVFPGNLLQGRSLGGDAPDPVVLDRAPGTVTINLINGSQNVSAHVDTVRYSNVIQAMNDIIAANSGTLPAAFTYRFAEVQSTRQMALSMGVNYNSLTTDVTAKLNLETDSAYSSYLVEFTQRYYTMSFDMPGSYEALFQSSVTPAALQRYVGPDNPLTYISSVTYGRRFYLLVESTESASAIGGSIQASYDAALAGGSAHLEGRDVNTLSDKKVKVFALGGDSSLALASFSGNVDAVAQFLTQGGGIDTGVPLSYTVRNAKDNTLVNVKVATDYEVRNCVVQQVGTYATDFENGLEGWTGYADFRDLQTRNDAASVDGSYAIIYDRGQGGTVYYRAPFAFHGDWSQFYGGELSYYMQVGGSGDYFATDDVVFYDGSGNRLAMRFSGSPSANGLFPRRVALDPTTSWKFNNATATEEQIRLVLSDVEDLFIRGEFRNGSGDWSRFDRFRVEQPE